jgi:60 kDa SS-A/Ro ribonucleoprotein
MAKPSVRYAARAATTRERTHEGAIAATISDEQRLRRSVLSCLLWEATHYEDGESVAERIEALAATVDPAKVSTLAVEARKDHNLRHVPLLLARALTRRIPETPKDGKVAFLVEETLAAILDRADEPGEFLALLWEKGKTPIPHAVRRGIGRAMQKFDEYQLAKWGRSDAVSAKDVLKLTHPKAQSILQSALWKKVLEGELATPDTWETELSAGKDKRETFERLIAERKLGALALLRNLRKMTEVGVSQDVLRGALSQAKVDRVLPFRFITAAHAAPHLESELEGLMFRCLTQQPRLTGKTLLVVDVSGSMGGALSSKSDLSRMDSAAALTMLAREVCEEVAIFATAGNDGTRIHATKLLPSRHGFALRDAFKEAERTLGGGGIFLVQCMEYIYKTAPDAANADRVIVFTDEQDCDLTLKPADARQLGKRNYLVNVATYQNGIGYGKWVHIDGFSERVLEYIAESEVANLPTNN